MGRKTIAMTACYAQLAPMHMLQALETLVRPGSDSDSAPIGRKMAAEAETAQAARKLNSTQLV